MILMVLSGSFTSSALSQSTAESNDLYCGEKYDEQGILRNLMDHQFTLELIEAQKQEIAGLKKELDLAEREKQLQGKIIDLKDREIQMLNHSFDQMKEISDRALKLAEQSKPKTNWGLIGTVLIAVFTLGLVGG
jgi:hypothetical protein